MLNAVSSLTGFEIRVKDGSLGTVNDFLFDDSTWKVRWMVVDTGRWLTGARSWSMQDRPVSQQIQNDIYRYYGWDPLWGGGMPGAGMYDGALYGGGLGAIATPLSAPVYFGTSAVRDAEGGEAKLDDGDPHLLSIAEVTGYHVHATDGDIGHVEDFLIESKNWGVRYLVVDTSNWWVGQHVLISPYAVKEVDWSGHHIGVDIALDKVRSSPSWNPANTITGEFERQLHSHYHWPA